MNDSRPRNSQGQFAPQGSDGIDANTTSTAYNPEIIQQKKLSLIEKIRRMRGVEESVPQREQALSAKFRLRELAQVYQQYPQEEKRGVGRLGALGLGLGLGIGGGVAGVKYLRPVLAKAANRAARNVTKGAKDVSDAAKSAIPEAAAAVKQTAADAQDAMAVGKDVGKIYQKVRPQVQRGFWNVTHPVKFVKEIYGEVSPKRWATEAKRLRSAVKESQYMPPAERLAFLKKAKEQVTPNPYKVNRPDWADKPTWFERLGHLVEFSEDLIKRYDPDKKERDPWGGRLATAAGAVGVGVGANHLLIGRIKPAIYGKGVSRGADERRREAVLDRFAKSKGYNVVGPKGAGNRVHAAVMPATIGLKSKKGDSHFRSAIGGLAGSPSGKEGVLFRPKKSPDFVRAHEVGHVLQKPTLIKSLPRMAANFAPYGAVAGLLGTDRENDKKAAIIAGAGTAMALPTLVNEVDASARGYRVMRKLGAGRMRSAGAFIGLPTYGALAAIPGLAWGGRKLRQKMQEKKEQK